MQKHKKTSTSKKLIWFLFGNCAVLELVVILVTFQSLNLASQIGIMPDFTPLITLIGVVVSEVIGYAIYSLKSTKENSAGGITYDMAMQTLSSTPTTNQNVG